MNTKRNQILLGMILLIIGLFVLIRPSYGGLFRFGSVVMLASGFAFILLYRTKRKSWSLLLGGYLTYIGLANMISPFIGASMVWSSVGAMFFIVPAVIFLVLYIDKNKRSLLLPASIMLWFGVFLLVKDIRIVAGLSTAGLFFFCIGIAFFMAYIMGQAFIGKWTVYIGGLFIIFGILRIFQANPLSAVIGNFTQFCSAMLILASIFIIIKAIKRKY